jgi:cytochrome b subunit of formate dehydrogenase
MTWEERRAMVAPPPEGTAPPAGADAPRSGLVVPADVLAGSVHEALRCIDCHVDAAPLPHARTLAPPACGTCHQAEQREFDRSSHAAALAAGHPEAPTCVDCHSSHGILPPGERASTTFPLNVVRVCGDCHEHHRTPEGEPSERVQMYLDSAHGKAVLRAGLPVAATCADCHLPHRVLPSDDPEATTSRHNITRTCGSCHLGVAETFEGSVHGRATQNGSDGAPVCTDCHTTHGVTRVTSSEVYLDIIAECGDCHDRPEMRRGRRVSLYQSYRASYHGQVTNLGSTRAARCSDCHGAHDIRPPDDPASHLHESNIVATCRACHEGANARFARYDPHADYRDASRYPVLHGVWLYFVIVMSLAFGFFGLHSILWFVRSLADRVRHGSHPRHVANPHAIRRFTTLNRINHALVIITFLGLTLTGIPLLFSGQCWAEPLIHLAGGVVAAGVLHRVFAIMLMINFAIHFFGLIRSVVHHGPARVRGWLFGPHSLLPRWKDVTDCARMFHWFFGGGKKPAFGRWTYWEKFDYWAEIFGTLIIGGSGLLLWFPEFFSRFLPGEVFNIAAIVHGYEALLALGFIFTIHFFNAHLRLEKFPVDDVIFTGRVPEEEFREERAEEWEFLVQTGRLDSLIVPVAPRWQARMAIVIGIVATAVGLSIVTLIVIAGLQSI